MVRGRRRGVVVGDRRRGGGVVCGEPSVHGGLFGVLVGLCSVMSGVVRIRYGGGFVVVGSLKVGGSGGVVVGVVCRREDRFVAGILRGLAGLARGAHRMGDEIHGARRGHAKCHKYADGRSRVYKPPPH